MKRNVRVVVSPSFFFWFQRLLSVIDPFFQYRVLGGVLLDAWKWVPGVWRGGVPRPLVWEEAKKKSLYQYTDALSFILLAEWIKERCFL